MLYLVNNLILKPYKQLSNSSAKYGDMKNYKLEDNKVNTKEEKESN